MSDTVGPKVTDSCELRTKLGSIQKQPVLLMAEPSLQDLFLLLPARLFIFSQKLSQHQAILVAFLSGNPHGLYVLSAWMLTFSHRGNTCSLVKLDRRSHTHWDAVDYEYQLSAKRGLSVSHPVLRHWRKWATIQFLLFKKKRSSCFMFSVLK